jgi:hypothetical protein
MINGRTLEEVTRWQEHIWKYLTCIAKQLQITFQFNADLSCQAGVGWEEVCTYHIQIDRTVLVVEIKLDGQDASNDDHQTR